MATVLDENERKQVALALVLLKFWNDQAESRADVSDQTAALAEKLRITSEYDEFTAIYPTITFTV